MLKIIRRV